MRLGTVENRRQSSNYSVLQAKQKPVALANPSSASSALVKDPYPYPPAAPLSIATQWLGFGRNLDFCLLAVCSCILAILCHQTLPLPSSTSVASQLTTSRVFPSQLDFIVKAGLFTSSHAQSEADEESAN
jgi:hypothetical protein